MDVEEEAEEGWEAVGGSGDWGLSLHIGFDSVLELPESHLRAACQLADGIPRRGIGAYLILLIASSVILVFILKRKLPFVK